MLTFEENTATVVKRVRQRVSKTKLSQIARTSPAVAALPSFTFIDLFAGIGACRQGFESAGGKCLFTCEWDKHSHRRDRDV